MKSVGSPPQDMWLANQSDLHLQFQFVMAVVLVLTFIAFLPIYDKTNFTKLLYIMTRFANYTIGIAVAFAIIFGGYLFYKVHIWAPPRKEALNNTKYNESDLEFCPEQFKIAFARVKPEKRPPNWEYFHGKGNSYYLAFQRKDGTYVVLDLIVRPE